MRVLLIEGGRVRNWVDAPSVGEVQDKAPHYLCMAAPDDTVGVGWLFDGAAFAAPVAPTAERAPIARIDFMRRFTFAEECAIRSAAKTDVQIEVFLVRLLAVTEVRPDHPETIAGVQMVADKGHIAPERVAQILE